MCCELLLRRPCIRICRSNFCLQVIYGGRVIDDFDRRILKTYLNEYMGEFLLDTFQPFHFYRDEFVNYVIPKPGHKDDYISKYI